MRPEYMDADREEIGQRMHFTVPKDNRNVFERVYEVKLSIPRHELQRILQSDRHDATRDPAPYLRAVAAAAIRQLQAVIERDISEPLTYETICTESLEFLGEDDKPTRI